MLHPSRVRNARATFAAGALALVLASAGCGGNSTKDTYKNDFKSAGDTFQKDAQQASAKVTSSPSAQGKVAGLESLKGAVDKAANNFAGLKPPDDVKATNNDLVSELRALRDDITKIEAAVKAKDQSAAQKLVPDLQTQQSKIQGTLQELKTKVGK